MEQIIEEQNRMILDLRIEMSKLTTDETLEKLNNFLNENTKSNEIYSMDDFESDEESNEQSDSEEVIE